jgi:hypothetical protein
VSRCIAFSGGKRWQDCTGTVKTVDSDQWVYVEIDGKKPKTIVPFRFRELDLQ